MARNYNTSLHDKSFSEETIKQIWNKGKIVSDYDPNIWRVDRYGLLIRYSDFGKTHSKYGWEICYIKPIAEGGKGDLGNLQPLHWQKYRLKGII